MRIVGVRGIEKVMRGLNREIRTFKYVSVAGLVKATAVIRNATESQPPLTPVDIGNLKASWLVVTSRGDIRVGRSPAFKAARRKRKGEGRPRKVDIEALRRNHTMTITNAQSKAMSYGYPAVTFGYSANYASIVHDKQGVAHWSRAGSGEQWFLRALERNKGLMLGTIANRSRIPKRRGSKK